MELVLAILPLLALAGTFLVFYNRSPQVDWRRSFLRAVAAWGGYLVIITEGLSLLHAVTQLTLIITWGLPALACGIWLWTHRERWRLPSWRLPAGWGERFLLTGIVLVLGVTALVAWLAPPHTWDSLNYHMPRVAHWAQDQAVHHYATGVDVQNSMPPGAEMIVLQFYVLSQSDRLANFVQWFSMAASLVIVSYLAAQLGAAPRGQWLAAAIAVSIPTGIIQVSSTMTDYVVALWVLILAAETLNLLREGPDFWAVMTGSLAGGLALLTKPISAAYVLPFGVLVGLALLSKLRPRQLAAWSAVAVLLFFSLNAGHLTRNTQLYGNPISGKNRIAEHANQLWTPGGITSNLLRNMILHTGTPWGHANKLAYEMLLAVHEGMGVDINDPRTTSVGPLPWITFRTGEDHVGNFFHALLIVISFAVALIAHRRLGRLPLVYTATAATTFLLFSALFKWQVFGSRYHMAFFVLFAPVIARVVTTYLRPRLAVLIGLGLIAAVYPFLFSIESRPVIPNEKALADSILVEEREDLYFANGPHLAHSYRTMTAMIRAANCSQVGLMLSGGNAESPLWMLMGAPRPDLQFGWIISGPSSQYARPDFDPCAVICQGCMESDSINDLPLVYNDGIYRLFSNSDQAGLP